jgi:hypothetical protein
MSSTGLISFSLPPHTRQPLPWYSCRVDKPACLDPRTHVQMQDAARSWQAREWALEKELTATRTAVDSAFRDNFDTPLAVQALLVLVSATNAYMGSTQPACPQLLGSGAYLLKFFLFSLRSFCERSGHVCRRNVCHVGRRRAGGDAAAHGHAGLGAATAPHSTKTCNVCRSHAGRRCVGGVPVQGN